MKKISPIEKIHEAFSAISDNRITLFENKATVYSSDKKKNYTVQWQDNEYSSNDNATYWQGYPGYPVIAVLMLEGKLTYDKEICALFKGINWKSLNDKHKRNYSKAVSEVLDELSKKDVDISAVVEEVEKIYTNLSKLDITIKRGHKNSKE